MNTLLISLSIAAATFSSDHDWPTWRGPSGNGVATSKAAPVEWDGETNVKWKVDLARPANGSPVVSNGRVFLTTPEDEEGKSRSLYCYDRADGKQLWVRTVVIDSVQPTHKTNPYCGSTPAADDERVVVWHSSGGLHCYDHDGKELWQRDLGEFNHMWGYGTSPVLHGDKVILNTGPDSNTTLGFMIALDLETGETLWKVEEPNHLDAEMIEKKRIAGSWATPVVATVDGKDQIICSQPTRIVAYDPEDGSVIWSSAGVSCERGDMMYSSPVIADEICFVVGGYEGPAMGIRLGGKGDVTESHRLYRNAKQMSNCGSGIYAAGHVFIPDMGGFLYCIDPVTGTVKWKERCGRGSTWGSVVQAAGKLYLMNQAGTTVVFEPNPESFEVVAENALDEATNSTPAIAGDEIFLRTHESLYCIANTR